MFCEGAFSEGEEQIFVFWYRLVSLTLQGQFGFLLSVYASVSLAVRPLSVARSQHTCMQVCLCLCLRKAQLNQLFQSYIPFRLWFFQSAGRNFCLWQLWVIIQTLLMGLWRYMLQSLSSCCSLQPEAVALPLVAVAPPQYLLKCITTV